MTVRLITFRIRDFVTTNQSSHYCAVLLPLLENLHRSERLTWNRKWSLIFLSSWTRYQLKILYTKTIPFLKQLNFNFVKFRTRENRYFQTSLVEESPCKPASPERHRRYGHKERHGHNQRSQNEEPPIAIFMNAINAHYLFLHWAFVRLFCRMYVRYVSVRERTARKDLLSSKIAPWTWRMHPVPVLPSEVNKKLT